MGQSDPIDISTAGANQLRLRGQLTSGYRDLFVIDCQNSSVPSQRKDTEKPKTHSKSSPVAHTCSPGNGKTPMSITIMMVNLTITLEMKIMILLSHPQIKQDTLVIMILMTGITLT